MKLLSNSPILLALACTLVAGAAFGQTAHLDKHARKIHHKLAKYPTGKFLHVVLDDGSDSYGALGALSEASFTFTNADNNTTATYAYADVDRVKTDKEGIGEGTEPRHHIRHLVPIAVGVAAVGAAGAVYALER